VRVEESRVLLAAREDVWALVAEPFNLPDWWPGYTGVEPDRRGLAAGARWTVLRSRAPGFLRKPRGRGLILIERVTPGSELAWLDVPQQVEAGLRLEDEGRQTLATAFVEGPIWRLYAEGARALPRISLARLHDLCQTAASL
jgi:uncharacterized protein YndB with AHSA1/START domain